MAMPISRIYIIVALLRLECTQIITTSLAENLATIFNLQNAPESTSESKIKIFSGVEKFPYFAMLLDQKSC